MFLPTTMENYVCQSVSNWQLWRIYCIWLLFRFERKERRISYNNKKRISFYKKEGNMREKEHAEKEKKCREEERKWMKTEKMKWCGKRFSINALFGEEILQKKKRNELPVIPQSKKKKNQQSNMEGTSKISGYTAIVVVVVHPLAVFLL